jgi:hypothetical protein
VSTDNPYQSPAGQYGANQPTWQNQPPIDVGLARQIPIVAILMIVQGVLEILVSFGLVAMAFFLPQQIVNDPNALPPNFEPGTFTKMITGVYVGLGAVLFIIGALKIFAGIQNYSYRGRILGVIGLVSGMGAIFGCYCLPTAIALMIYGLIVYLNSGSERAFALGTQGYTREQIRAFLG